MDPNGFGKIGKNTWQNRMTVNRGGVEEINPPPEWSSNGQNKVEVVGQGNKRENPQAREKTIRKTLKVGGGVEEAQREKFAISQLARKKVCAVRGRLSPGNPSRQESSQNSRWGCRTT